MSRFTASLVTFPYFSIVRISSSPTRSFPVTRYGGDSAPEVDGIESAQSVSRPRGLGRRSVKVIPWPGTRVSSMPSKSTSGNNLGSEAGVNWLNELQTSLKLELQSYLSGSVAPRNPTSLK